ncbi:MAG: SDR family oxidoreductase, partial [Alphaproteobacteria bacterium]|nr:SDR family oxidoreductase [Alphaproteobacteria bacterium]
MANDRSIAWGVATMLHRAGAQLSFSYQNDTYGGRVEPLARQLTAEPLLVSCAVERPGEIEKAMAFAHDKMGGLDFVVHSLAFSDKAELDGRFINTSRDNFLKSMDISCYSFINTARAAMAHMPTGGSLLTLSYEGATRVMKNYNVMGVCKAALEATVRYLADDLGAGGIRVNALAAGPMRTLAGSAVASGRATFNWQGENNPLRRNMNLNDIGGSALYLLSDMSHGV